MAKNHKQDTGTTLSQEEEVAEYADREEQEDKYYDTISGKRGEKYRKNGKLTERYYLHELAQLQEELVKFQYWIKETGLRVAILFEGRDAAGKGASLSASRNAPTPVLSGLWLSVSRPNEKSLNGILKDGQLTFRRRAKWCYSTGVGTRARLPRT